MGRPSKAKLLEITLKLQQDLCANCSMPLKDIDGKITKILPGRKYSNSRSKELEVTLSGAILTVFEAALKINRLTISGSDTVLYMCENCACRLSELYWAYKEFLGNTNQESYIRAAIKSCLLWKEGTSSVFCKALIDSPGTNTEDKNKKLSRNSFKTSNVISTEESMKDENESDHYEVYDDDPNDEDYLPETEYNRTTIKTVEKSAKSAIKHDVPRRNRFSASLLSLQSKKSCLKRNTKKCTTERLVEVSRRNLRQRVSTQTFPVKKSISKRRKVISKEIPSSQINKKQNAQIDETNLCKSCGKRFKAPNLLKAHLRKCMKIIKNSICRYCGKKFSLKLLRDRHENILHSKDFNQSGESLACNECGKSFKNLTFLRRHASVHSTAKPFQCETCLKSFKRFDTLQEHQRGKSHALSLGPKSRLHVGGNTSYPCKICDQVFKHKVSLFRHESKSHMEDRPFGCDKCWKRYRNQDKLSNHVKTAHDNKKEKERVIYSCDLCDKTYTYLYSYKAHVVTHVIDKPFLCSQCGNSFRQKQGFLRHMSTMHKGENRHTCNVCGKSFKRKDHLTQHLRGKTHGKPPKEKKSKQLHTNSLEHPVDHKIIKCEVSSNDISQANKSTVGNYTCSTTTATSTVTTVPLQQPSVNSGEKSSTTCGNSSVADNLPQTNVPRPGVIVPPISSAQPTTQNNNMVNQPQNPPNFTFSASNLFFDF